MAITNTWSISDMQRTDSDGYVFLVYWSMVAASDGENPPLKTSHAVVAQHTNNIIVFGNRYSGYIPWARFEIA